MEKLTGGNESTRDTLDKLSTPELIQFISDAYLRRLSMDLTYDNKLDLEMTVATQIINERTSRGTL